MVWDRITTIFKSSVKQSKEKFSDALLTEPLSQTCYVHWYLKHKPNQVQFNYSTNPFGYIFHYENKYHLSGEEVWQLNRGIRWFNTNIVLIFRDSSKWTEIQERFHNFRSLETNKQIDTFNTYNTYQLKIDTFNPRWSELSSIVELPNARMSIPKRYRHLEGGIAYAYVKDKEVLSFAAAPHIYQEEKVSFAIIRGIETKLLERQQGYAYRTMTKLCQDLLASKLIKFIYLWVDSSNTPAINLYKKLGFVEKSKIFATYCDPQP